MGSNEDPSNEDIINIDDDANIITADDSENYDSSDSDGSDNNDNDDKIHYQGKFDSLDN